MKKVELSSLNHGDNFQIKENGKWYTVHCQAISKPHDTRFDREHYTIAVCNGKRYVFDAEKMVFFYSN